MSKTKCDDIKFLKEMLERLKKAPWDITQYKYIKQMINDWIKELTKK